ncbi:sterol desaturase family protein [Kordiimonas pumila]|uniref:Sterol desaturase family protein n=1 Tax=Kordiimonas pumila TaxID=2161677 RepID=A0ABV7D1R2_9PROT|nr:sterol desaturase family protein [Kordiimonas pumila]
MTLDLPEPTQWAVPLFVVLVLAEMVYGWKTRRVKFESKDTFVSMFMGLGSTIAGAITLTLTLGFAFWVYDNFRVFDLGTSIWVFVAAFILDDLAYYWVHRFGHRMRWMWAAHVIHHSSQHYNLSTALRQTWTGQFTPGILFRTPLFLLGFHPSIVFFCAGLNLIYQFWIHTEAIGKMPRWFEAIMNTPSHHRVHHAKNPRYLDANYAGVFIIWDKIFGTYIPEEKSDPCNYGLVTDLGTYNPLRIAFHEWWGILKDIWHAPNIKAKLLYLIAPPGWTHDESRQTSDMIRREWQLREQAKTPASPAENS